MSEFSYENRLDFSLGVWLCFFAILRLAAKEQAPLRNKSEESVDVFYIDAMANGHREVLAKIDNYLDVVINPVLKEHLKGTRHHVKMHLEKALDVQKKHGHCARVIKLSSS